jgi:hypothetical protein
VQALRVVRREIDRVRRWLVQQQRRQQKGTKNANSTNASGTNATQNRTTKKKPRLPEGFLQHDYIAKIDVEGHEVAVAEGAKDFIRDRQTRPRMWVSEVWKTLNITRYGEIMIGAGYVGLAPTHSWWMFTVDEVAQYHRELQTKMDTVIWVEPQLAKLLLKSYINTYPTNFSAARVSPYTPRPSTAAPPTTEPATSTEASAAAPSHAVEDAATANAAAPPTLGNHTAVMQPAATVTVTPTPLDASRQPTTAAANRTGASPRQHTTQPETTATARRAVGEDVEE